MTDAERLALAKRLYDAEIEVRNRFEALLKGAMSLDEAQGANYMLAIHQAKITTIEAMCPELMEVTQ